MKKVRVLLADDHIVLAQSLAALFERETDMELCAQVSDGEAAVGRIQALEPDVAVVDVGMPRMTGIEVARKVVEQGLRTAVVLLSRHTEPSFVREALLAGARGYVAKDAEARELLQAIRAAAAGKAYFSPSVAETVAAQARAALQGEETPLTPRERDVLRLVAEGLSSKEIATRLSISTRTVEGFRKQIMRKLDIHSIAGLVKYALEHHLASLKEGSNG